MARRLRFWLLWPPLGFLALAVLAWFAWYGMARWQLGRIKGEIAAAGLSTTAAGVIPAEIPEADNAVPLLARAGKIWGKLKDSEGFITPCLGAKAAECNPQQFDAAKLGKLQAQMQGPEMQEIFRLVREASNKPAARFDRDYSKGMFMDLELESFGLAASRLLGAKAWLAARQGHQEEAAGNLWTASRLASFWMGDTIVIGWLVGSAVDRTSMSHAQIVLACLPNDSFRMEDWKSLDEIWAAHARDARRDLARILDAERVLAGGWFFEGVMDGDVSLADAMLQPGQAKGSKETEALRRGLRVYSSIFAPWFLGDYAAYLRHMLLLHDTVRNGAPGDVTKDPWRSHIPRLAFLTRVMAVALDSVVAQLAEYEVNLQLARLGLALEDFRSHHGKYPEALPELGLPEAMITDPFSGAPFVYRPEGDNVLVYSIGVDRADGGGVSQKRRDIVWRVERKQAAEN